MKDQSENWDSFVLLLIDVQKDFWTDEMSKAFPHFEKYTSELLDFCRSEAIDVVHLRAKFQPDKSDWITTYKFLDRIPCIDGTPGVEIFDFAKDAPGEKVITKQTFDGFLNSELDLFLVENHKKFVFVAGLVTSVCVLLTAASAAQRGYLVGLIENCCADKPESHTHTLERYPFVFDRVTVAQIAAQQPVWLENLRQLSQPLS